jgi:hypothetical protein
VDQHPTLPAQQVEEFRRLSRLRWRASLAGAGFLLAVGLGPFEVSHSAAAGVALAGLALLVALTYLVRWFPRALRERRPESDWTPIQGMWPFDSVGDLHSFLSDAVGQTLRAIGPALLAVAFIVGWTLVLMLLWAADPAACSLDLAEPCAGAFRGLGERAAPGDFIYLAVNGAVASTPPDLVPTSRVAHMALAVEFCSGAVLIGAYALALVGAPAQSSPAKPTQARP